MPVRIYDIAKNLGVESKVVLQLAKELGIVGAKVASSSIDKISAEYLETKFRDRKSGETKPAEPEQTKKVSEPVVIVAPEPEDEPKEAEDSTKAESAQAPEPKSESAPKEEKPETPEPAKAAAEPEVTTPAEAPKAAPAAEPDKPGLGAKVGFINLSSGPARGRDRGRGGAKEKEREKEKRAAAAPQKDSPQDPRRGGPQGGQDPRRGGPAYGGRPGDRRDFHRGDRGGRGGGFDRQQRSRETPKPPPPPPKPKIDLPDDAPVVTMKPPIIVRELADALGLKAFQVIADLMEQGVFAKINEGIDEPAASVVCAKHGHRFDVERRDKAGHKAPVQKKAELPSESDKEETLLPRAPVVTIMGHVDHGKTTLLDRIRKSDVAAGEAGGITQHIGAYTISVPHPENPEDMRQITFLDTPGHAAFSAMRARGANVTDVVILVVAADDGVMPQTLEALDHALAAEVPIIVAVNKCDHPSADPLKARQQFQSRGLTPEDWGGETIFCDVSAMTGQGVEDLLGMVLLQADVLELKANPNRGAFGNIVESGLEPGGPTATALVRTGTLKVGDVVICETFWGKVRALIGEDGARVKKAGPSTAVKILGLNGVPEAGSEFHIVKKEREAKQLVEERIEENKDSATRSKNPKVTLESLLSQMGTSDVKTLRLLVKADTQGSVEAIVQSLNEIKSDKVKIDFIHQGVGSISESDILLSSASEAIVIGFHTRLDPGTSGHAKRHGVQIKQYSIIYELIDEVRDAMAGLLEPETKETVVGTAEVKQVFGLSKGGRVAGCIVTSGRIHRGKVRLLRNDEEVITSDIQTLKRFQDDVNEVRNGQECGIRITGFDDIEEGDVIEAFTVESIKASL